MTQPRILADRIVERVFKKRAPVTSEETPISVPHVVTLQIEEARKQRQRRQEVIDGLKEF